MRHQGADYLVVAGKRSNVRGAKEVGHLRRNHNGSTGDRRNPPVRRRAAALVDGTSRVTGDCHARICERLGVKFPGPTRRRGGAAKTAPAFSFACSLSRYDLGSGALRGGDLASTSRVTAAQATVEFLKNQYVERYGVERRFFAGCFGIFGHGNVAGIGQALQQNPDFPYYLSRNEQAMCAPVLQQLESHRLRIFP